MERTVPSTASEEIELYLKTIYSLLRSTSEVQIRTLEEAHAGTDSSLHLDAREYWPDASAFIYASLRLPDCISDVTSVVLGQTNKVFEQHGYEDVADWQPVSARARRRRCAFDGEQTLACFIASRSDIDDFVPTLVAYQIEWNKLNLLLTWCGEGMIDQAVGDKAVFTELADALQMSVSDLERLRAIWGADQFADKLKQIKVQRCSFRLRLLNGSLTEYWRATQIWWNNFQSHSPELAQRPVYFISSNTHSVANLLTGFGLQQKDKIVGFLERSGNEDLLAEWRNIQDCQVPSSIENFLYYALKKMQSTEEGAYLIDAQHQCEESLGLVRVLSNHTFDVETQAIELRRLSPEIIDPRLAQSDWGFLKKSDAVIVNIDYPLGLAAYNILTVVAEHTGAMLGIYIMGKAATLNGILGDVMIPSVSQDEHSRNTYLFRNAFTADDVAPYLAYGSVMDNQKSVSVLGTFLQNNRLMDVIYREGYTDIEMEAGPYLSAVYEMSRPKRHPIDEIVNLYGVPFDVGILHYASDTPLSKGKNLGAGTLSYRGIDSTYGSTIAILRRIFALERERCA
jgi:hypothetical protein